MTDLPTPSGGRLDRAAVERIIQRAAELQAGEHDIGEGLTEGELASLARDVGIPENHLRQALIEERTRSTLPGETGFTAWLVGPKRVGAARTIAGEEHRIESALSHWMVEGELLMVKRRFPQHTTWEPKQGAVASIRRALSFGGRSYLLTRAREVTGIVAGVDPGRCHVQLIADLSNTRADRLGTAAGLTGLGAGGSVIATVLGVMAPVSLIPAAAAALLGMAIGRGRRTEVDKVHVALEQILDRLEHNEIEVQQRLRGPRPSAFVRIADELLKRELGPGRKD